MAVGLAAATACVVEDALNDLALWRICVERASPVVEKHPRLLRSLGAVGDSNRSGEGEALRRVRRESRSRRFVRQRRFSPFTNESRGDD